ncbi:MAG: hypothetical protein IPG14_10455 [Dehalococcoidia bacterium]|nr:hypothetical protein [Dehalococcoidia bacterium]
MGGAIAQTVALHHPQRLAGLILVGTGARLAVSPAILDGLSRDYAATARLIAEWAYKRQADPATLDAYAAAMLKTPVNVTHGDFWRAARSMTGAEPDCSAHPGHRGPGRPADAAQAQPLPGAADARYACCWKCRRPGTW